MLPVAMIAVALALPLTEPEPSLTDLARFPDAKTVEFWLNFNEVYEATCWREASAAAWSDRRDWWASASIETHRMREAWSLLRCAHVYGDEYPEATRNVLRSLRGEIGPARYWSGTMPPPVPFWRFQLR